MIKLSCRILVVQVFLIIFSTNAFAGDFDWTRELNMHARSDPSGFRARLEARFQIGDVAINMVLTNCESPADAYLIFRLGEISGRPIDYILQEYNSSNGKGWGVMARHLGIKPGSREFHALKRGHDLYTYNHNSKHNQLRWKVTNGNKGKGRTRR